MSEQRTSETRTKRGSDVFDGAQQMKIDWKDWRKQKPKDEPGHYYLVWSEKYGLRLIRDHPSWWNLPAGRAGGRTPGPRVRFWAKVDSPVDM